MVSLTARELRTEMTQHITNINTDMGSMETPLSSGGYKSLYNNSNRINSSVYAMELSAQAIGFSSTDITIGNNGRITDFNGTVDFSYATVRGVARANSSGIGISYSPGTLHV